jgi:hypothetical protein
MVEAGDGAVSGVGCPDGAVAVCDRGRGGAERDLGDDPVRVRVDDADRVGGKACQSGGAVSGELYCAGGDGDGEQNSASCGDDAAPPASDSLQASPWWSGQIRVVGEDPLLQLLKIRAGLEPKLIDQRTPGVLVDLERFGLSAAAVESKHQ